MRELKSSEVEWVSGAGLTEFLAGLNNSLTHVNNALAATNAAIEASTNPGMTIGLTHKQFGLSIKSGIMTGIYNVLSFFDFNKSA